MHTVSRNIAQWHIRCSEISILHGVFFSRRSCINPLKELSDVDRTDRNADRLFQYPGRMLTLGVVVVPLICYLSAAGISSIFFISAERTNSHTLLKHAARQCAAAIDAFCNERIRDLDFVLQTFTTEELRQQDRLDAIQHALSNNTDTFAGLEFQDNPTTRSTAARGGKTPPLSDPEKQQFRIAKELAGPSPATIRATIKTTAFQHIVSATGASLDCEIFLVTNTGQLLAHYPETVGSVPDTRTLLTSVQDFTESAAQHLSDETSFMVMEKLQHERWRLIVRRQIPGVFRYFFQHEPGMTAIVFLGGMAMLALALSVSRRISHALADADDIKDHLRNGLARSTRLAELGEMTSGFAHEINNPLQIMESEITMMDMELQDYVQTTDNAATELDRSLRESLEQLQEQIRRCSKITRAILMFARQDLTERSSFNVQDVMRDVGAMVFTKTDIQSIAFRIHTEPADLEITNDAGKLRQVLLNLLNNAIDAVVDRHGRSGGHIDLTARPHGRGWIRIEVVDDGPGLPQEILANMYTPFFTTKPPQKGKGLGLAVCYGLIESMGGSIDVETHPGMGTAFTITLPSA